MNSCPFKDMFGKPNQGFHKQRIGPFALNDVLGTIALSGAVSYTLNTDFISTLITITVIGEFSHYYFCVDTALMNSLN